MFYEEIRTKQDLSYIPICSLAILYNSKIILVASFLGTNAVVVIRVHCIFLLCFSMKYKDFSVKSNSTFSLFQMMKIRFSKSHCLGLLFSSPDLKTIGELIRWQPLSLSIAVHTSELEYLCSLLADLN